MSKTCGHKHVTIPNCDTCRIAELEKAVEAVVDSVSRKSKKFYGEVNVDETAMDALAALLEADNEEHGWCGDDPREDKE